jgi:hypothetical protein
VSHEFAERVLQQYRQEYVPCFPFVPIPGAWSARYLSIHHPFLFAIIIQVVSPQTHSDRSAFYQRFRQSLTEQVVRDQRKTLEMLQAILLFTAW